MESLTHFVWVDGKFLGIDWSVWKAIGWCGNVVFFSRFFVQWYATERRRRVVVPRVWGMAGAPAAAASPAWEVSRVRLAPASAPRGAEETRDGVPSATDLVPAAWAFPARVAGRTTERDAPEVSVSPSWSAAAARRVAVAALPESRQA